MALVLPIRALPAAPSPVDHDAQGAATVVTVYLFPAATARVGDKPRAEPASGTRVVAHDFALPDWSAERILTFRAPERSDVVGRSDALLFPSA